MSPVEYRRCSGTGPIHDRLQRPPPRHLLDFLATHHVHEISHGHSTLLAHLLGTWEILRDWNLNDATCNAGLFHSVYGTEQFEPVCISPLRRQCVERAIGKDAEQLAYWFCRMERLSFYRANWLEKLITIRGRDEGELFQLNRLQFAALAHILLANWLEQRPSAPAEVAESINLRFAPLAGVLLQAARAELVSCRVR